MVSWGSGTVAMDGGEGNDTLQANGPATGAETLSGGNGDDVLQRLWPAPAVIRSTAGQATIR